MIFTEEKAHIQTLRYILSND